MLRLFRGPTSFPARSSSSRPSTNGPPTGAGTRTARSLSPTPATTTFTPTETGRRPLHPAAYSGRGVFSCAHPRLAALPEQAENERRPVCPHPNACGGARSMTRARSLILFALVLGVLALAAAGAPAAAQAKRPNVIFVFTDDHASHAISAYGSKIKKTPPIDRLAKEGKLFRNCFCTNSICAPSRAVILTGKHSHLNGVIDNIVSFDGSQQTFSKLLQTAGYQTAMIGKWHLKSDPTGFDHWMILYGQGTYYNPI